MLIQEILDSTRGWETLRNNSNIDAMFNDIHDGLSTRLMEMQSAIELKDIVGEQQWVDIKNTLNKNLNDFFSDINSYLQTLSIYQSDLDLIDKIKKCKEIEAKLTDMFKQLP